MERTSTHGEIVEDIIEDAELVYLHITKFFNFFKSEYFKLREDGRKIIDKDGKETLEKLLSSMLLLMKNPVIRNSDSRNMNINMLKGRYWEMIYYFGSFNNVDVKEYYLNFN